MRREKSSSGGVALCRSPGVVMEPVEAERPRITWDFSTSSASSVLAGRWEGGFCVRYHVTRPTEIDPSHQSKLPWNATTLFVTLVTSSPILFSYSHYFGQVDFTQMTKWNQKMETETLPSYKGHTHFNKLEKWSFKHGLLPTLQQTLEFVVPVQNNCSSVLFIEPHQICMWPLTSTEPIESTLTSMRELIQQVTSLCLALNKAFCGRLGESSPVAKCRE